MKTNFKDVETELLEKYIDDNPDGVDIDKLMEEYAVNQYKNFSEFFNEYAAAHEIELPLVMKRSNISKGYFYNMINGDRNPSRDKVICLCIGAGMDLKHTNRALKIAKYSALYVKDERDYIIRTEIVNGENNVVSVNLKLDENGMDILE